MRAIFDIISVYKPGFKVSIYNCDYDIKEKRPPMKLDGICGQAHGRTVRVRALRDVTACSHFELL